MTATAETSVSYDYERVRDAVEAEMRRRGIRLDDGWLTVPTPAEVMHVPRIVAVTDPAGRRLYARLTGYLSRDGVADRMEFDLESTGDTL